MNQELFNRLPIDIQNHLLSLSTTAFGWRNIGYIRTIRMRNINTVTVLMSLYKGLASESNNFMPLDGFPTSIREATNKDTQYFAKLIKCKYESLKELKLIRGDRNELTGLGWQVVHAFYAPYYELFSQVQDSRDTTILTRMFSVMQEIEFRYLRDYWDATTNDDVQKKKIIPVASLTAVNMQAFFKDLEGGSIMRDVYNFSAVVNSAKFLKIDVTEINDNFRDLIQTKESM